MPKTKIEWRDAPGFTGWNLTGVPEAAQRNLLAGTPSSALTEPVTGDRSREAQIVETALAALRKAGVDFGDLRLGREHTRALLTSDENIKTHRHSQTAGIGIRAWAGGFWGFCATADLRPEAIRGCADQAASMAKAAARTLPPHQTLRCDLAPEPAHVGSFHTPVGLCPLSASIEELAGPFREAAANALTIEGIKRALAQMTAFGYRRIIANTDGAYVETSHCVVDAWQRFIAVKDGRSAYRTVNGSALAGGWEHVLRTDYPGKARAACHEALLKCTAEPPPPGQYTLILDGHNLALTMHESVGHPTELDRVLGYELDFAGGSFADLSKHGTFRYGAPLVNFTADNTLRFGGASQGFDDEGVQCQSFPVVRDGILVGYGTNRETASQVGESRANGTCRATSWKDTPIVRIPNLYLEPGSEKLSLDDLIGDTKDGILMMGRDSFSIDQMRYNFQFGSDMAYRIRDGKRAEPLRDVIYQSTSAAFWNRCDAICDETEWQMHGVFNCGKGQPIQIARMMHGAAPSRFHDIEVGF